MRELQANNPDDDQENGDQADDMIRIAEKDNSADDGPSCADSSPYGIRSSNGNALHRLRDGKEAKDDEDHRDDARDDFGKSLAEF